MRHALATTAVSTLATFVSLSLVACDKDDGKGSAGAASSASAAASVAPGPSAAAAAAPSAAPGASAAVAGPTCPAGLTGNPVPAFCIKLPPKYAVKDPRISPTRGSISYDTGTATDNLMISYDVTSITDQTKDVESELKFGGDKIEKKGDLPGGGKWYTGSHQDYERVVTLTKGPSGLTLKCSFAYQPKNAPSKDAIDACKSIVVPVAP